MGSSKQTPLVLMAGTCSQPLVSPLARGIRAQSGFRVAALDLFDPWGDTSNDPASVGFDELRWTRSLSRYRKIQRKGAKAVSTGGRIRRRIERTGGRFQLRFENASLWKDAEVMHWHGLFNIPQTPILHRLGARQKLLVSIWGSDLMRTTGVSNYRWQRAVLDRADRISVHGVEMKQVLLAKFGWDLEEKVRFALFGAGDAQLAAVDAAGHERVRAEILDRFGIAARKVVICIGHNGEAANRQIEVIEQLSRLPPDLKSGVALVLPASYGAISGGVEALQAAAAASGFAHHVLTEFLDDVGVAALRHASDILVFVPRSDAMSAALSQTMATGNIVIVGAWLPYAAKRIAGVYFREVSSIEDILGAVVTILGDLKAERQRCAPNRKIVLERFSTSVNIPSWLAIYDELVA